MECVVLHVKTRNNSLVGINTMFAACGLTSNFKAYFINSSSGSNQNKMLSVIITEILKYFVIKKVYD